MSENPADWELKEPVHWMLRYCALISYARRDKAVADWLHHALETDAIPAKLIVMLLGGGQMSDALLRVKAMLTCLIHDACWMSPRSGFRGLVGGF